MIELPRKLSALLRIAVEDAQKAEATPGYVLHMGTWHSPRHDGVCRVCMAGAVMAMRLEVPRDQDTGVSACAGNGDALNAVDDMRVLEFEEAAWSLGVQLTDDQSDAIDAIRADYREHLASVEDFSGGGAKNHLPWPNYLAIANRLEQVGL